MFFAYTVVFKLNRELPERELDTFVQDLWSFKRIARVLGTIFNGKMTNYLFNVYNETDFNTVNDKFSGRVRIYFETDAPVNDDIADMNVIANKFDAEIIHVSCKFKMEDTQNESIS